jgi:hypothetical protein
MPSSYWTKQEKEIFDQHFLTMKWESLLELLPNKTSKQIMTRGSKLGFKRESDVLGTYYDDEKKAWIERKRVYVGDNIGYVSNIFPSSKDVTFEDCKEEYMRNFTNVFFEKAVKKQYQEMLRETGAEHDDELFKLFWEIRMNAFKNKKTLGLNERLRKIIIKK